MLKQLIKKTMKKRSDTTVAINGVRNKKLDEAVIKVIIESKEQTKKSEIVQHLIDHYLIDTIDDLIEKKKRKKEQNK